MEAFYMEQFEHKFNNFFFQSSDKTVSMKS